MTDGRKETNLSSAVEHGSRSSCGQVGAHGPEEVSEDGDPPRRGSRPGTCARGLPAQHVCPPVARTQQGRRPPGTGGARTGDQEHQHRGDQHQARPTEQR